MNRLATIVAVVFSLTSASVQATGFNTLNELEARADAIHQKIFQTTGVGRGFLEFTVKGFMVEVLYIPNFGYSESYKSTTVEIGVNQNNIDQKIESITQAIIADISEAQTTEQKTADLFREIGRLGAESDVPSEFSAGMELNYPLAGNIWIEIPPIDGEPVLGAETHWLRTTITLKEAVLNDITDFDNVHKRSIVAVDTTIWSAGSGVKIDRFTGFAQGAMVKIGTLSPRMRTTFEDGNFDVDWRLDLDVVEAGLATVFKPHSLIEPYIAASVAIGMRFVEESVGGIQGQSRVHLRTGVLIDDQFFVQAFFDQTGTFDTCNDKTSTDCRQRLYQVVGGDAGWKINKDVLVKGGVVYRLDQPDGTFDGYEIESEGWNGRLGFVYTF